MTAVFSASMDVVGEAAAFLPKVGKLSSDVEDVGKDLEVVVTEALDEAEVLLPMSNLRPSRAC